jgi:hypothetical protein
MNTHPETQPPDLALQLPRDGWHQVIHTLLALSPPPVGDTSENRIRRENAAITGASPMQRALDTAAA